MVDDWNKLSPRQLREDEEVADPKESPNTDVMDGLALFQHLRNISEKTYHILWHSMLGLTVAQIGIKFGIPPITVERLKQSGIAILRSAYPGTFP